MEDPRRRLMRFHVLTLFPRMFDSPLSGGVIERARASGLLDIRIHDIRDYAHDRHRTVDDYPFGGGPGMLMKAAPLFEAVEAVTARLTEEVPVVLLSPQGRRFTQRTAEELARLDDLVLVCGRYEGVDERVRQNLATDEISIGDYVLSGGELGRHGRHRDGGEASAGSCGQLRVYAERLVHHRAAGTFSVHQASRVPGLAGA